jgi:hypothetical protein
MTGTQPPNAVLRYATPPRTSSPPSRYAFASLAASVITLLWLGLAVMYAALPFDPPKQHRIGSVASVFALILAIAAYRQPNRGRSLAHVAITAAGLTFFAYFPVAPI